MPTRYSPPRVRRLRNLQQHLLARSCRQPQAPAAPRALAERSTELANPEVEVVALDNPGYEWTKHLRGTIWEEFGGDIAAAESELSLAGGLFSGQIHRKMQELTELFGNENFTVPRISHVDAGRARLEPWLVICNPDDAARIARMHTKKARIYGPTFLGGGIFGLTDNDEWRAQRYHLLLGVLPVRGIGSHFETVKQEAVAFVDALAEIAAKGDPVELNELLAAKTLAVFGKTLFDQEEHFSAHSEAIRMAFVWDLAGLLPLANTTQLTVPARGIRGGAAEREYAVQLGVLDGTAEPGSDEERSQVRSFINRFSSECLALCRAKLPAPGRVVDVPRPGSDRELAGPGALIRIAAGLDSMARESEIDLAEREQSQLDTVASLVFAGHDTTANTLSWCCYELARNPTVQCKLQAELDEFYGRTLPQRGRPLAHADLQELPYLTQVLHETLRLWPVVHYGSLRELQREAKVTGVGGAPVAVPAGTQVHLPPFALHHSTALWGNTAAEFDPDRAWQDRELYGEDAETGQPLGLRGWNPKSSRFAPFQAAPRQCLGLNFAQMEMRLLLSALLRRYTLTLAGPTADPACPRGELSIARPLLRPALGIWVKLTPRTETDAAAVARGLLGP